MGLGIIGAALAAAGDAGVQSMNQRIQHLNQMDQDEHRAQLEQQKQMAILEAQKHIAIESARQMREEQAARISSAAQGVAQGQVDSTFADHDAALAGKPTSGTPLTPEQQQVIQSTAGDAAANKASYKTELMNDPHSYVAAAMRTGDITPEQIAHIVQQQDALKRQEAYQVAQFAHEDASRKDSQEFQAGQADLSRAHSDRQAREQRDFYASMHTPDPATVESTAKAIAEKRLAPLTGYALRSPGAQAIMAKVLEIDPAYDAREYAVSQKALKNFGDGPLGTAVKAFNTAILHLDTLNSAGIALKNGDTQMLNKIGNAITTQTGAPAPTSFDAVKHIVAAELVKAIAGSSGALADRQGMEHTVSSANSPEQLARVIDQYKELMVGQLSGLKQQYKASTGLNDFEDRYLSDESRKLFSSHKGGSSNPPATVPNPMQPTGTLTYDPKTGTFH